jgi:hypothetical protein
MPLGMKMMNNTNSSPGNTLQLAAGEFVWKAVPEHARHRQVNGAKQFNDSKSPLFSVEVGVQP